MIIIFSVIFFGVQKFRSYRSSDKCIATYLLVCVWRVLSELLNFRTTELLNISELLSFSGKLHQVGLDESVNLAIHHTTHIARLPVGAVVFHTTVIEDIRADL